MEFTFDMGIHETTLSDCTRLADIDEVLGPGSTLMSERHKSLRRLRGNAHPRDAVRIPTVVTQPSSPRTKS